jgi:hypothetical protein
VTPAPAEPPDEIANICGDLVAEYGLAGTREQAAGERIGLWLGRQCREAVEEAVAAAAGGLPPDPAAITGDEPWAYAPLPPAPSAAARLAHVRADLYFYRHHRDLAAARLGVLDPARPGDQEIDPDVGVDVLCVAAVEGRLSLDGLLQVRESLEAADRQATWTADAVRRAIRHTDGSRP